MKTKSFLLIALSAILFFASCKKDTAAPQVTFSYNVAEGTANNAGEFNITGHISSVVRLDKVTLTIEGQSTPFMIDESTAKNKNEYDYSYLVTGITANTFVMLDVYNQEGEKVTARFLIRK